jgi:alpha-glucuronidase
VGSRSVAVLGPEAATETVFAEMSSACARYGGRVGRQVDPSVQVVLALTSEPLPPVARLAHPDGPSRRIGAEGYLLAGRDGVTIVLADDPIGLLYGLFHILRWDEAAFMRDRPAEVHRPASARRMLDHWDNVEVHPVMGQVERGYAGGSLFWRAGRLTPDLDRVGTYARLLAGCGLNAVAVNNVNVHRVEAHLLADRLDDVAAIADRMRPFGVRVHLSVSFAAPIILGGLGTADPLDPEVRQWWAGAVEKVYAAVPDFGGFVVKADSEGQPGPFAYGRSHADGANLLADALAGHGGVVHWRAFVYNHRQDWRDRGTDRARAAYDHFAPLDGQFRDNVILQVKHGPIDFQTREPVSPVIAAMPQTRIAVELQATQEYTGQQQHVCYLAPMWSEVLRFPLNGALVADVITGQGGGLVAVANTGDDVFWTGHPLAQANLYAVGRLAWDPMLDPLDLLDEWIALTFPSQAPEDSGAEPAEVSRTLHALMADSWRSYELYTAPLGVGFMVRPGRHYGPDVDGYEYTPWGTYHFADRDGVGVDRTRATGSGFTGQYPAPWRDRYESPATCPDELLLFFHHVPYGHRLHQGSTVIQHIYDSHFAGYQRVVAYLRRWQRAGIEGQVGTAVYRRVEERLEEQVRSAGEWRDQINTYFFRKSGIPDERGRPIH